MLQVSNVDDKMLVESDFDQSFEEMFIDARNDIMTKWLERQREHDEEAVQRYY